MRNLRIKRGNHRKVVVYLLKFNAWREKEKKRKWHNDERTGRGTFVWL